MRRGEIVGTYTEKFNAATGQHLPCGPIYQSTGLIAHVKKRHPSDVDKLRYIPEIISNPDFIGKSPKEPSSIELVKIMDGNIKVCIKLDARNSYFYVATLFEITTGKLESMIKSGRLSAV